MPINKDAAARKIEIVQEKELSVKNKPRLHCITSNYVIGTIENNYLISKIAKVIYPNGVEKFTGFSPVTDMCFGALFSNPGEVREKSFSGEIPENLQLVEVKVSGYNSWFAIATDEHLISPLTPFGEDNVGRVFEGVLHQGIIHLRRIQRNKVACGHHELTENFSKKYIFSRDLRSQGLFENYELIEGDIFKLAATNKVCLSCLSSKEVCAKANYLRV